MAYQNLFNLLSEEYNLNLLQSELQEIIKAVHQDDNEDKGVVEEVEVNLTVDEFFQNQKLKDKFASKAMQSLILKDDTSIEFNCKKAYQYAEEMLKQRNNINL